MGTTSEQESGPINFRPLNLELCSGSAGAFDGSRVELSFETITLGVVAYHEATHERLSFSSPDGLLLALCMRAGASDMGSGPPVAFKGSADLLYQYALQAHESAATYLSVKMFSPAIQAKLIGQLPKRYREYYALLADVIDARAASSYLQYMVGLAVATVAFTSRFLERVVADDWSRPFEPPEECRPDVRLHRTTNALQSLSAGQLAGLVQPWADELCAAADVPMWDLNSEEQWAANVANSRIVEPGILAQLAEYLAGAAKLDLLTGDDLKQANRALAKRLLTYGINLQMVDPGPDHASHLEAEHGVDGYVQAASVVQNPRFGPVARASDTALKDAIVFDPRLYVAISSPRPEAGERLWTFVFANRGPEGPVPGTLSFFTFSEPAALDWLEAREALVRKTGGGPTVGAVTVGVGSLAELDEVSGRLRKCLSGSPGSSDWPAWIDDAFCWYLDGNVLDRIDELLARGPLHYAHFRVRLNKGDPAAKNLDELAGLDALTFRSGAFPGLLLRMLNFRAGAVVSDLIDGKVKKGTVAAFDEKDSAQAEPIFKMASDQILAFWKSF